MPALFGYKALLQTLRLALPRIRWESLMENVASMKAENVEIITEMLRGIHEGAGFFEPGVSKPKWMRVE